MKLTPQHISPNGRTITAYRIVLGSRKARQCGLIDSQNKPKDFLFLHTANGILIATKDEYFQCFEHNGHTSDAYRHGNLIFGEIPSLPSSPTWFTTSADKAEQSFRKAVDSALDMT